VLLERVLSRLREEHRAAGKGDQFDRLQGFLTGDAGDVPYKEAADTLGMSEGALKVAVHRLRRRYRETLMEEIAETVSSQEEIDAEIQYLLKAVSL
jgi:RNA polymerase sigma-70 factor (ECF subfamily)